MDLAKRPIFFNVKATMAHKDQVATLYLDVDGKDIIRDIGFETSHGAISEIENAIKGGDKAKALKLFDKFQSQLMKVSKKGSIRRQTASRKISRTAKKLAGMK